MVLYVWKSGREDTCKQMIAIPRINAVIDLSAKCERSWWRNIKLFREMNNDLPKKLLFIRIERSGGGIWSSCGVRCRKQLYSFSNHLLLVPSNLILLNLGRRKVFLLVPLFRNSEINSILISMNLYCFRWIFRNCKPINTLEFLC